MRPSCRRSALAALALAAALQAGAGPDPYAGSRASMVEAVKVDTAFHGGFVGRDELSPRLLAALGSVPRHEFVPAAEVETAYENRAIQLGGGRSLPAPYVTAILADLLDIGGNARVLEVGTGCGYEAALLSSLAARVLTLDPDPNVVAAARERLARLGYGNVTVRQGDLETGWQEEGILFDAILVSNAVDAIPQLLLTQLRPGGNLVVPVHGEGGKPYLTVVHKNDKGRLKPKPRPLLQIAVDPLPR